MKQDKIPLIVIFGPTASGKTAAAIKVCKWIGGEVVSADSMQIYKFMDIGSAKPSVSEMDGIKHHMIDFRDPRVNYSLADYVDDAKKAILEIHGRGKMPVLAGGTGLYIDTIINGIVLSEAESDTKYREYLSELAEKNGNEFVYNMLVRVDKESAEETHPNNLKRVIRALEFFKCTGIKKSEHKLKSREIEGQYNILKFGMDMPRDILYDRINKRVDIMLENGLVDEVKRLISMGVSENSTAMQGIGYKETRMFINGEITYSELTDMIKQSTRRYAKRQITWFKREKDTVWVNPLEKDYFKLFQKTIEISEIL